MVGAIEKDIRRFQVSMHYATLMRRIQSFQQAANDCQRGLSGFGASSEETGVVMPTFSRRAPRMLPGDGKTFS